jgi:(p)ppGpp synthase/HD superfamily hydrolase
MQKKVLEDAARIAVEARQAMKLKDGELPDIIHPVMVAVKLIKHNFPDEVVAAGLVHDVLEETDYPEEKLNEELGDGIMKIVRFVMEDKFTSGEQKRKNYHESIHNGCEGNVAVIIADRIHDLQNLLLDYEEFGSAVWHRFNCSREQKIRHEMEVLNILKDAWKHLMVEEYELLLKRVNDLK